MEAIIQCFLEANSTWVQTKLFTKNQSSYIQVIKTKEIVTDRILIQEIDGDIYCFIKEKE